MMIFKHMGLFLTGWNAAGCCPTVTSNRGEAKTFRTWKEFHEWYDKQRGSAAFGHPGIAFIGEEQ